MRTVLFVLVVAALGCNDKSGGDSSKASGSATGGGETASQPPENNEPPAPKLDRSGHPPGMSDEMLDAMDAYLAEMWSMNRDLAKVGSADCAKATAVLEQHEAAVKKADAAVKKFESESKEPENQAWINRAALEPIKEIGRADGGVIKECNVVKKDEAFSKTFMRVSLGQ